MIKRFECINIYTENTKRLVEFYNDKLGIPIVFEGFGNYDGAKIGFNKTEAGIVIWDEKKWGKGHVGKANFVFSCDNLDTTYEELKAKGVELDPPIIADWGGREMNLKDLDGNNILLLEQQY
ncbi:Glyoxalase-like domain-containing protein [Natronincola peptidivorans]|uniref:Glyoxalase-like domain-containing protein n=1 Tax=Natronincola peptidivorans TaxID=426128 RepID=A0A1I0DP24_9FIRM|nr:VOC family protein [Natronincola peptidivorans]SET33461.1 Glyoxalase-like domain-containing protein [Natronincola peptidivorans]